jgi:hypothetical protein
MTNPTFFLPAVKNNATTAQLIGAIGAGDTTVVLKTGHAASLPTILRGDCSSTGDGRTLNDTGALGSVAVGDYIYNLTDGSWAVVTSIAGAPNSVKTTPLEGGSDNTWQSGDVWIIGSFIATIVQYDDDAVTVLKRERVRVTNIVSDTLTVQRGYDGDTAQTFLADDSVQVLIEQSQMVNLQKAVRNILGKIDEIHRGTPWYGTTTGSSNAYAVTLVPAVSSYTDIVGLPIALIANFGNTGASTLNVNGLGAKNIYKQHDQALASGDIENVKAFIVIYDGTQFQLQTPVDTNPPSLAITDLGIYGDGSDGALAYTTGTTNVSNTKIWQATSYSISSGAVVGVTTNNSPYIVRVAGDMTISGKIDLKGKGGPGSANQNNLSSGGNAGTNGASYLSSPWSTLFTGPTGGGGGAREGTGNNGTDGGSGGGGSSMFNNGNAASGSNPGTAGAKITANDLALIQSFLKGYGVACGSGGGGGGSPGGSGTGGSSGDGGAGGGAAAFLVKGNITINATAIFDVSGNNGTVGAQVSVWSDGWGGGGGGGGGTIVFFYTGTLTVNGSPTYTVAGGTGAASYGSDTTGGNGAAGRILSVNINTGAVTSLA